MIDDDFFGRPSSTATRPTRPVRPTPERRRADAAPAGRGRTGRRPLAPERPSATTPATRRGPRPEAPSARRATRSPRPEPVPSSRPRRSGPPAPPTRLRPRPSLAPGGGVPSRRRTVQRLAGIVVVTLVAVGAITARLVDLQVTGRGRYVTYGASQRDGYRALPAGRGAIYDRDGKAFALSAPEAQVIAAPIQIKDPKATAKALAELLKLDEKALVDKIDDGKSWYKVVAPTVSQATADEVRDLALPGITLEDLYPRSNPSGGLASAVIGHALPDGQVAEEGKQGLSGIELQYDDSLQGRAGSLTYDSDRWGNTLVGGDHDLVPAVPGTDLYLTLDQSLQYQTERALADQVTDTDARSAMAVIMQPSTGNVLAMASVGVLADGTVGNTALNQPVTALFEPGSVNKMITVAGAIEDGQVDPDTVLEVPDHLEIYDRSFTDHDPHETEAWSVTDILVTSSNIGTIKIAQQLGKVRVDEYLRSFGFGTTTGLGFPAEENGILRDVEDWSGVDIGSVPIGQGISVTALQMLSAYNTIANGGTYVAPKLVAATDAGDGQVETAPSARRQVVSPETAASMRAMLAQVVTDGTGKLAAVPGYEVAGKTGTARIPQQGGADAEDGYVDANGDRHYWSTFVGLVNGADLSVIVAVEDAQTSIYGSDVAAPVFADLAGKALLRYRIPPPALVSAARHDVPELSSTARDVADSEDVTGGDPPAAG